VATRHRLLISCLLIATIGAAVAVIGGNSPVTAPPSKQPASNPVAVNGGGPASPTVLPPSPSAPAPTGPTAPALTSIHPGSVDRTSIDLSATYDADVRLGFDDRRLGVDAAITVTNRSGGDVDRVELNTIAAPLGNLRLGPSACGA